jgi:hypothetical protein
MESLTNIVFLKAIFGDEYLNSHVTGFSFDPSRIPKGKNGTAWKGGLFKNYKLIQGDNQYFTISTFNQDGSGVCRRRKSLYKSTYCIVLDDVKEKLNEVEAKKLPPPSWVLETSIGSEQWGFILDKPCINSCNIDNLNDGLIESDLAPSGKDPGQKGITRYVRLPEGFNTKIAKSVNGVPHKCKILSWNPSLKTSLEAIAKPFKIDLWKQRKFKKLGGAGSVLDHPFLTIPDTLSVRSEIRTGVYDIMCPWVVGHSFGEDTGSAIFTNNDSSMGFKCHHGSCESRTGADLLDYIESKDEGFKERLKLWKVNREFAEINTIDTVELVKNTVNFKNKGVALRESEKPSELDFYSDHLFVAELNKFYDFKARIFLTPEAFQNSYCRYDKNARRSALEDGKTDLVKSIGFFPNKPTSFERNGQIVGNTWQDIDEAQLSRGNIDFWEKHFDVLGWGREKKHLIQWLAFTLRHPEKKINHMIVMGGGEGVGKDFLLMPIFKALGNSASIMTGDDFLSPFNSYLLSCKFLQVNEINLGRKNAGLVREKLKPLAAAPPLTLTVNIKNVPQFRIENIVNTAMTTNSRTPFSVKGVSRRFYAVWSDLDIRDSDLNVLPKWKEYWSERWQWMNDGGWRSVAYYLMNEVDLSDFNHAASPPMTHFLKKISLDTESLLVQTIRAFIAGKHDLFSKDLATAVELSQTLRAGALFPDIVSIDPKTFTSRMVYKHLRSMQGIYLVKTRTVRVFILRNSKKYLSMKGEDLMKEYEKQKQHQGVE